jgi:hypothetical protein
MPRPARLTEIDDANVAGYGTQETTSVRGDFLVVDAVSRNRSAKTSFPPVIAGKTG